MPRVPDDRADRRRRPRLHRRRHHPRHRPVRLHGDPGRARRAARCSTRTRPRAGSTSTTRLLPVQDRARRGRAPTMAAWRKRLFVATSYITADAAEHFGLPRDRTVIMGSHIDVERCPAAAREITQPPAARRVSRDTRGASGAPPGPRRDMSKRRMAVPTLAAALAGAGSVAVAQQPAAAEVRYIHDKAHDGDDNGDGKHDVGDVKRSGSGTARTGSTSSRHRTRARSSVTSTSTSSTPS